MTRPGSEHPRARDLSNAQAQPPPAHPGQAAAAAPPPAHTAGGQAVVRSPQAAPAAPAPASRSTVDGVATVIATAEAEASAQTMPVAAAAAAIATGGAPGPRAGTLYGSRDPERDVTVRDVPQGRQPRLRIGWHTASRSALTHLGVGSPGTGLILGADHDQKPVAVRFFRPEPTRVTLVGGVWAGQLLAFRALALGAQLVVMTIEPAAWQGLGERAVGRNDRVVVLHGEQPGNAVATARQPVLVIHDLGMTGPTAPPNAGPWQTQLTVLRRLDERGIRAVQRNDLLMLQRLHPTEAAVAESALRLTGQSAHLLQMMEDEMMALIGGGANRYLWLHPTAVERQFMGNAWR